MHGLPPQKERLCNNGNTNLNLLENSGAPAFTVAPTKQKVYSLATLTLDSSDDNNDPLYDAHDDEHEDEGMGPMGLSAMISRSKSMDTDTDIDFDDSDGEEDFALTPGRPSRMGPIASGVGGATPDSMDLTAECEIVETLKEGWVDKKGSGNDWLANTEWKPRWACLAMTKVAGGQPQHLLPVLHLYWHETFSTYPSTSISLEFATVVKGAKRSDVQNSYSFDILPVDAAGHPLTLETTNTTDTDQMNKDCRSFAVPMKERTAWMKVMNDAIDNLRRQKREGKTLHFLSPPRVK
jgi:hypothetical protein